MLPGGFSASCCRAKLPQPKGWSFEVFYEPAREVGGDFYDFYDLGEGSVGVVVGDVTDKGMPAALVMASCRTVLRGIVLGRSSTRAGRGASASQ